MSVVAVISGTLADGRKWRAEPDAHRPGQMVVTTWSRRGLPLGSEVTSDAGTDLESVARNIGGTR